MHRARERLGAANLLMNGKFYNDVCNRSYYAVFESTHAMLAAKGIEPPGTHRGLKILFDREIVNKGLFDKKVAKHFHPTKVNRLLADYKLDGYKMTSVGIEHANKSLSQATTFVNTATKSLRKIHRAKEKETGPSGPSL